MCIQNTQEEINDKYVCAYWKILPPFLKVMMKNVFKQIKHLSLILDFIIQ